MTKETELKECRKCKYKKICNQSCALVKSYKSFHDIQLHQEYKIKQQTLSEVLEILEISKHKDEDYDTIIKQIKELKGK